MVVLSVWVTSFFPFLSGSKNVNEFWVSCVTSGCLSWESSSSNKSLLNTLMLNSMCQSQENSAYISTESYKVTKHLLKPRTARVWDQYLLKHRTARKSYVSRGNQPLAPKPQGHRYSVFSLCPTLFSASALSPAEAAPCRKTRVDKSKTVSTYLWYILRCRSESKQEKKKRCSRLTEEGIF